MPYCARHLLLRQVTLEGHQESCLGQASEAGPVCHSIPPTRGKRVGETSLASTASITWYKDCDNMPSAADPDSFFKLGDSKGL